MRRKINKRLSLRANVALFPHACAEEDNRASVNVPNLIYFLPFKVWIDFFQQSLFRQFNFLFPAGAILFLFVASGRLVPVGT